MERDGRRNQACVHCSVQNRADGFLLNEIGFLFSVMSLWSQKISLLRTFFPPCFFSASGFNISTLLDETSFLFVQTIHFVAGTEACIYHQAVLRHSLPRVD